MKTPKSIINTLSEFVRTYVIRFVHTTMNKVSPGTNTRILLSERTARVPDCVMMCTWRRFMAGPLCVLCVKCEDDVVVAVVVSRREGGVETSKGE